MFEKHHVCFENLSDYLTETNGGLTLEETAQQSLYHELYLMSAFHQIMKIKLAEPVHGHLPSVLELCFYFLCLLPS